MMAACGVTGKCSFFVLMRHRDFVRAIETCPWLAAKRAFVIGSWNAAAKPPPRLSNVA